MICKHDLKFVKWKEVHAEKFTLIDSMRFQHSYPHYVYEPL